MSEYKHEIQARVLKDSTHGGEPLTTMEVTMHRYMLPEFNTHRAFSRNSASSRAIPGHLQRQRVLDTPAMPPVWPSKQRGMQGGPDLPPELTSELEAYWTLARDKAVEFAGELDRLGVHKSVTNRLIEPFLYQTVIVTGDANAYGNFFLLRLDSDAQPEIRMLAEHMKTAYNDSEPTEMEADGWHMPLVNVDDDDTDAILRYSLKNGIIPSVTERKVSAARCARVSYLTHDGKRDIEADLTLYDRLVEGGHWSPLEHVATPNRYGMGSLGNFHGWEQLRHRQDAV
jgi:thymidylate synthase ThyX